jgi:hypothetical protein
MLWRGSDQPSSVRHNRRTVESPKEDPYDVGCVLVVLAAVATVVTVWAAARYYAGDEADLFWRHIHWEVRGVPGVIWGAAVVILCALAGIIVLIFRRR